PALCFGKTAARLACVLFVAGCGFGLVGFATRRALVVASLAGVWLLGLPQLYGGGFHSHHLIWVLALLAARPCGDAWPFDARGRAHAPSAAYALPVHVAWLLIGLIYFFPGYWKWKSAGLSWATSDNLVNQMRWKWIEIGALPWIRIDRHPTVCHLLA